MSATSAANTSSSAISATSAMSLSSSRSAVSSGCIKCMHLSCPGVSHAAPALSACRCWLDAARAMGGARASSGSAASLAAFSAGFCFPQCFVELRPGEGRCRRLPWTESQVVLPAPSPTFRPALRSAVGRRVPTKRGAAPWAGRVQVGWMEPRLCWTDPKPPPARSLWLRQTLRNIVRRVPPKWEGVAP